MGDQEVHGSGSVLSVVLTFLATPGYNSLKFPNNCEALLELSADNGASWIKAISAHLGSVDTRTETVPLVATFPSTKERPHREEAPLSMLVRYGYNTVADCGIVNTLSGIPLGPAQQPVLKKITTDKQFPRANTDKSSLYKNNAPSGASIRPPPMGFNSWNRWHCWV